MNPLVPVAGSLVLLLTLLAGTSWVARRQNLPGEVARKFVHVGLGLYCLSFPLVFSAVWQVIAVCGGAVVVMLGIRTIAAMRKGLGDALHNVGRKSYGEMLFAVSVALLFLLMKGRVVTYVLPLTILTISDAAAALVGAVYGRKHFRIADGQKSWEGAAIFFLTAWIIALIELLLLTDAPRANVVLLGLIVALYGTLIEAESWHGWDNLFVPLALYMLLRHHLQTAPVDLLLGATLLVGGAALARALAPLLGYDRHGAYVATSVLATIAIASTAWNVALPIGMFLADSAAQRWRPYRNAVTFVTPSLSVAMIALVWYVVSDTFGLYTVYAFNVSFAALGAGLLWLAPRHWIPATLGTVGLWLLVQSRALVQNGVTPLGPTALVLSFALLVVVAAAAAIARGWISTDRHLRLGGPALIAGLAALPLGQP